MTGETEDEKLNSATAHSQQKPSSSGKEKEEQKGWAARRVGFDFVATLAGSVGLGWLIDRSFGTAPWGVVVMIFVGFVVGLAAIWRAMQRIDGEGPKRG